MGKCSWPCRHAAPVVTIPQGSRLKEGQRVSASYHFATIAGKSDQINCCFSEPKVYDLLAKQVQWVKETVEPDFYMMRTTRSATAAGTILPANMTCGQMLAENVRRCEETIRKADPGKPIVTWNDMFDPFHNARKEGWMYLAKGWGPWYGSWEGLPPSVLVANWHQNDADSLKFFADRGHAQILAGSTMRIPRRIVGWLSGGQGPRRLRRDVYHVGRRLLEAGRVHEECQGVRGGQAYVRAAHRSGIAAKSPTTASWGGRGRPSFLIQPGRRDALLRFRTGRLLLGRGHEGKLADRFRGPNSLRQGSSRRKARRRRAVRRPPVPKRAGPLFLIGVDATHHQDRQQPPGQGKQIRGDDAPTHRDQPARSFWSKRWRPRR